VLFVAASFLLPAVHWRVIGWIKGEAFYQGRPTSYWRGIVKDWNDIPNLNPAPSGIWTWLRQIFGDPDDDQMPFTLPNESGFGEDRTADPEAFSVEMELLRDEDNMVSVLAYQLLINFKPEVRAALPELLRLAKHPDPEKREMVLSLMCSVGPYEEVALPAFIAALGDEDEVLNYRVVLLLDQMGSKARQAVPSLLDLYRSKNNVVPKGAGERTLGEWIIEALAKIDPEAAAKAGVK
jgi:hypothetical protein